MIPEKVVSVIESLPGVIAVKVELGDVVAQVAKEGMLEFFTQLKTHVDLRCNLLLSVTAVDWLDARDDRFEVVYHLRSLVTGAFVRVKLAVSEDEPVVTSVGSLWHSALFMEREVWDMFGIEFQGHPDLRRVLMYEEFKGHPLRKDYPVQGKQPRIALRAPEVRNTAMDMQRGSLMKIGRVS
jgi:NADH-quinone oxidoreductase subunit C